MSLKNKTKPKTLCFALSLKWGWAGHVACIKYRVRQRLQDYEVDLTDIYVEVGYKLGRMWKH